MSFKPEVIADNSGKWASNALRFRTREGAERYVTDLALRWILVRDTRVIECSDPVGTTEKEREPFDCPLCGQHIDDGKPCGCGAR